MSEVIYQRAGLAIGRYTGPAVYPPPRIRYQVSLIDPLTGDVMTLAGLTPVDLYDLVAALGSELSRVHKSDPAPALCPPSPTSGESPNARARARGERGSDHA